MVKLFSTLKENAYDRKLRISVLGIIILVVILIMYMLNSRQSA